ncbi:ankyrin repeat domain-containing protein [bacterium]|nr:MAG: ankyrin repeat domain-containing protein [bacterium]
MKKIPVALFLGFMGLGPMVHPACLESPASPILSTYINPLAPATCECAFCIDDDAKTNRHGIQHIHFAAWEGELKTVKDLISQEPALVNARDYRGMTPLLFAARSGNYDMVEFLLESGADYLAYDNNQSTQTPGGNALHHLFYGLEPSDKLEYTTNIDDIYDLLIEAGTSPYLEDGNGKTPADVYNDFINKDGHNNTCTQECNSNCTCCEENYVLDAVSACSVYQESTFIESTTTSKDKSSEECSPTEIMINAPAKVHTTAPANQSATECSPTEIMSQKKELAQPYKPHLIFEGFSLDDCDSDF